MNAAATSRMSPESPVVMQGFGRVGARGGAARLWTALRLALLPLLFAPAACLSRGPVTFTALDISGADYARDFQLQDADGRTRTLAEFSGRVVMVFFGFTQCPDACPTALARAAEVMRRLGPDAARLQVVFVTIDPERDSAAMLRDYTRAFHPSFLGLRGDLERTRATARDFKVFYTKVPTGASYTMDHSTFTYVYDPRGRLRLAVKHAQSPETLVQDLRLLLDGH